MKTTELQFKDEISYDAKVDIEIKLLKAMSSEDYKTVIDAADVILKTVGKYLDRPEKLADKAAK